MNHNTVRINAGNCKRSYVTNYNKNHGLDDYVFCEQRRFELHKTDDSPCYKCSFYEEGVHYNDTLDEEEYIKPKNAAYFNRNEGIKREFEDRYYEGDEDEMSQIDWVRANT